MEIVFYKIYQMTFKLSVTYFCFRVICFYNSNYLKEGIDRSFKLFSEFLSDSNMCSSMCRQEGWIPAGYELSIQIIKLMTCCWDFFHVREFLRNFSGKSWFYGIFCMTYRITAKITTKI